MTVEGRPAPDAGLRQLRRLHRRCVHREVGTLTNDFFVNLLDMDVEWHSTGDEDLFEGSVNGQVTYPGTRADVVFGSNSELHALAEVYASDDAENKFVADFVAAFAKVRDADRHDV